MASFSDLISVIIPVYNVAQFLPRCLDSIIHQSFKNVEIICVNDGSTDSSLSILEEYVQKDKRVVVLNQKNMGLSEARNNGLKVAKGKWVSFIDSDDWVDLDFFKTLLDLGEKNQSDIVMSGMKFVTDNDISNNNIPNLVSDKFCEKIDYLSNGSVCDKIFKKELFEKNNIIFPKGRYWEDNLTLLKLIYFSNNMSFTNEVYYYYYKNDSSICNNKDLSIETKRNSDRLYISQLIIDFAHEKRLTGNNFKSLKNFVIRALGFDIEQNKKLRQILGIKFFISTNLKKKIVRFICCFIPIKSYRHKIRNVLLDEV